MMLSLLRVLSRIKQVQRFKKNIKPQILEMIEDIGKHPGAAAH
jgi:hypothetical protein